MNSQAHPHPHANNPADSQIVYREVNIANDCGLHMRPAAELVRLARRFKSDIRLIVEGQPFTAIHILDLLRANLTQGKQVTLVAEGEDAAAALSAVEEFFQRLAQEDQHPRCPAPRSRRNSNAESISGQAA